MKQSNHKGRWAVIKLKSDGSVVEGNCTRLGWFRVQTKGKWQGVELMPGQYKVMEWL